MKRLRAAHVAARSERGAALVMALLVLVVLTAVGLTLIGLGLTEVAISTNWRDYTKDFYAAEAALENGVVGLRNLLASTPQPTPAELNSITAGLTTPTLTDPGLTFGTYSITTLAPSYQSTFASGPYAGLLGIVFAYQIRAQVNGQSGTRADLTQVFHYSQVPLFQFGVFYGQGVDLEIAPGPDMTFNGRVHANSNIYVGAGNTLLFDAYITTAGGIYRTLKREHAPNCSPCVPPATPYPPTSYTAWGNHPRIKDALGNYQTLNFDSKYQPGFSSTWATPQAWAAQAESTFGGTVKDSAMGVGQITPPIPELFQNPTTPDTVAHQLIEMPQAGDSPALAAAKMYSQAQVRVIDGVATGLTCGTVPAGAITTTSFWDAREAKTVNATQVDVNLLRTNSCIPDGGVVYVASTAAVTDSTMPAVRLVNGQQLPAGGMTVVSQNPVYVLGNYNTVGKRPAAIMGDAITVLSQAWADSNLLADPDKHYDALGNAAKTSRPAGTTTVNAAFALGPGAESTQNLGNGQLENAIRFLEDWAGKTFNYAGSIIALWHSTQATGQWACCTYYGPPTRNWSYDTLFNTSPPPGTPQGVIMSKGRWSQL